MRMPVLDFREFEQPRQPLAPASDDGLELHLAIPEKMFVGDSRRCVQCPENEIGENGVHWHASFKRLYRTRAEHRVQLRALEKRASDKALTFLRTLPLL